MKFSKRVAYCGSLSALMFSLSAGAMQGQDQGQAQNDCKDALSCEVDLSQAAPELVIGKDWDTPYSETVTTGYTCKLTTTRTGSKRQIITGVIKFFTQEDSGKSGSNSATYEYQKVPTADDSCQKQEQVLVDQFLDVLNTDQFDIQNDDRTVSFLTAEGRAYDVKLTNFTHETFNFAMTRVVDTEGPNCERHYTDDAALRMIRNMVSRAETIENNKAQIVSTKFVDVGHGKKSSKRRVK